MRSARPTVLRPDGARRGGLSPPLPSLRRSLPEPSGGSLAERRLLGLTCYQSALDHQPARGTLCAGNSALYFQHHKLQCPRSLRPGFSAQTLTPAETLALSEFPALWPPARWHQNIPSWNIGDPRLPSLMVAQPDWQVPPWRGWRTRGELLCTIAVFTPAIINSTIDRERRVRLSFVSRTHCNLLEKN